MSVVWPVVVPDWSIECCGEPFDVGDRVAWSLYLDPAYAEAAPDAVVDFTDADVVFKTSTGPRGPGQELTLRRGGLTVAFRGAEGAPLRGVLVENHHGGAPMASEDTNGVVRSIRAVAHAKLVELVVG